MLNIEPSGGKGNTDFTVITGHPFTGGAGTNFELDNLEVKEKMALTYTTTYATNANLIFKVNGAPALEFVNVGTTSSAVYNFEMENLNGLVVIRFSRIDAENKDVFCIERMIYTGWGTVTSIALEAPGSGYSTDTVYYGSYR